jgi:CO/xanthine dehydrogenase FAD-binding subunit
MMHLPQFEYYAPKSVEEACSLLAKHKGHALPLAGGTDLLVKMKQRRVVPEYVINLKTIPDMDYITYDEKDGLRIGALTTIQSIKNSLVVKRNYKILHQAAGAESSVQIRNRATIGGNITNASPAADAPLALLVLGAQVVLAGLGGERQVFLENFSLGPGKNVLQPDEILREIRVPHPLPLSGGAYLKHALRQTDISIVAVAALLSMKGDLCEEARIGLGSVAPTAVRARKTEELLRGQKITEELIERATQTAREEARPIDDIRGYAEYRLRAVAMLTKNAIIQAVREAKYGGI